MFVSGGSSWPGETESVRSAGDSVEFLDDAEEPESFAEVSA